MISSGAVPARFYTITGASPADTPKITTLPTPCLGGGAARRLRWRRAHARVPSGQAASGFVIVSFL